MTRTICGLAGVGEGEGEGVGEGEGDGAEDMEAGPLHAVSPSSITAARIAQRIAP
ncbi:MAG: hypothetical protein WBD10_10745 [Acidobacteriaceae bacterium]